MTHYPTAPTDRSPVPSDPPRRVKPRAFPAMVRFGVVGAVGVVVNLAALQIVHGMLNVPFPVASATATETAIVSNYVGNELWTFHLRELHWGRLGRFNLVALLGAAVTVAVATAANQVVDYRLAQLVGIAFGAGVNFAVNFLWTWR